MNIEFAGRYNKKELFVKEFKYWLIIIRENVVTLGSCVMILKSGVSNFSDVSEEEMAEFPKVCKWFEEKTKKIFGAEKWNYCSFMMAEGFVHFHAIPRYSKTINMYDREWIDSDWPKRTSMKNVEVDNDTLMKIKKDLID